MPLLDRRPDSITEESLFAEVDERHGVVKSPTTDEEHAIASQKMEAYLALTEQMNEAVSVEAVIPPDSIETGTQQASPHVCVAVNISVLVSFPVCMKN